MYKSELKQLDDQFENNGTTYIMPGVDISQHLLSMNSYLADIDELLSDAGLEAIDHHDFTNEIDYSNNFLVALMDYAKDLKYFAVSLLDTPFKENLRDNAVDKINNIDINSYSTDNTLEIKQRGSFNRATQDFNYTTIGAITFEDFIVGDGNYDVPEEFKGFTAQFATYYENVKSNLGDVSEEEFLYALINKDTPEMELKKFVSTVLDITIIKPLIETFTGEDLITGQELSDMERGIKFAGAVVGIITLGTSGLLDVPLEEAVQQLGRTLLIDVAATSASYATGIVCEELDLPVAVTVVLCIAAGTAVGITLNGIEYRNVTQEEMSGYDYLDGQLGSLKDKVDVNSYQSSESINSWWADRGYTSPPYTTKTVVQDVTLTEDVVLVRVYDGEHSFLEGGWLMRPEDIYGLTPKEIQIKYALEYEPVYIGEVRLQAGDRIRLGEVAPNFGYEGGGIQIDLQQQWIGEFEELGLISEWRK